MSYRTVHTPYVKIRSQDESNRKRKRPPPRRQALFIGINSYADPRISRLYGAVRDMQLLAEAALTLNMTVRVLLNETATALNVKCELVRMVRASQGGLAPLVYFCGHGSNDNSILLYDAELPASHDLVGHAGEAARSVEDLGPAPAVSPSASPSASPSVSPSDSPSVSPSDSPSASASSTAMVTDDEMQFALKHMDAADMMMVPSTASFSSGIEALEVEAAHEVQTGRSQGQLTLVDLIYLLSMPIGPTGVPTPFTLILDCCLLKGPSSQGGRSRAPGMQQLSDQHRRPRHYDLHAVSAMLPAGASVLIAADEGQKALEVRRKDQRVMGLLSTTILEQLLWQVPQGVRMRRVIDKSQCPGCPRCSGCARCAGYVAPDAAMPAMPPPLTATAAPVLLIPPEQSLHSIDDTALMLILQEVRQTVARLSAQAQQPVLLPFPSSVMAC